MSSECASKGSLLPEKILYRLFPTVTGHSRNWSRRDNGYEPSCQLGKVLTVLHTLGIKIEMIPPAAGSSKKGT